MNQHLFKVMSNNVPKWFCYFWTKHHLPDFRVIAADKATTMGHIQRQHLKEAKALKPPHDPLHTMDQIFAPIVDRLLSNAIESRTLATLRDTLLPRLLSGEIRVKEAEKLAGAIT